MDNEQERHTSDVRGSHSGPQQRVRLPGYDDPPHDSDYWAARGYRGHPRDDGIRRSRRASTWTAAALIAGVAATTGYLAHSIPASGGSTTTGGTTRPTSPATVSPAAPAVHTPVATSGGSGAGGGGDN